MRVVGVHLDDDVDAAGDECPHALQHRRSAAALAAAVDDLQGRPRHRRDRVDGLEVRRIIDDDDPRVRRHGAELRDERRDVFRLAERRDDDARGEGHLWPQRSWNITRATNTAAAEHTASP